MVVHQLCKEYPALSPYQLEEKSFYDVIRLYADVRRMQIREKKINDPDRVIRRPAGDDWF
jgi:hypothetical protein